MKNCKKITKIFILLLLTIIVLAQKNKEIIGFNVDYKNYLSKHDIVFLSPNYEGFEGLNIGNGDLGVLSGNCKIQNVQKQL